MTKSAQPQRVRLCLVCDEETITAAVRIACPPPHDVIVYSLESIVDAQNTLSDYGQRIVQAAGSADAVLVAWRMDKAPVINTLCFQVRRTMRVPVIALCASHPEEQVAALAAGADDAMTFPLYLPLVQMKILAYHRLMDPIQTSTAEAEPSTPATDHDVAQYGALRIDRRTHRFYIEDQIVPLTPREFKLLDFLIDNADAACTRDQILDHVWGITFDTGTNMVDVYMYFLRKKLAARGLKDMIQTVRGYGYRLTLNPSETPERPA